MNKQRKVLITTTYNEMGIIIDTKAEEVAQPNLQPTCNQLAADTISRQAAIDVIDKIFPADPMRNDYTQGITCGAALATEYIKQLPSAQPEQKTDEWIPISKETNPTKSGWYLVTVHEDATNDNERFTGMAEFNATNGMWYDIDEPTDMYLRWMPLPAPYRGGGKE